jgi:tripartite-type tricarboxylate transporter receptor subunit TctC
MDDGAQRRAAVPPVNPPSINPIFTPLTERFMSHRNFVFNLLRSAVAATMAGLLAAAPALAQDKPVVKVLVGFPPGAGTDTLARVYAEALANSLNVTTVVENKTGAGGQLAAQALKAATPESNSIMFAVDHQVVMVPLVNKSPGFDVNKDMVPIARIVNFYTCLAVPAQSPAQDFQGYLDAVKKDPAQGNYGVPAPGSQAQFVGFVVGQHFKVAMNPVPYRGAAPAIQDLVGAQVPAAIVPCDALVEYRKAGRVRVLAMASDKRYPAMKDVPTFAELGVKMPADAFLGVYAAASMKPEMRRQITEATRRMFDDPKTVEKFASTGMEPAYANPEELRQIVDRGAQFWGEQVRKSNFQTQ